MDTSDIGTSTSRRGRRGAATPVAHEAGNSVVLGPRDSLVGSLTIEGDVHIEGSVEGEIAATGEVNVHSTGTARARIEARDIVIAGAVEGSVVARGRVSIGESATLSGELQSARLRVDEGATVNARIAMRAPGDVPPARRSDRHDGHKHESEEHSVDVTGSPTGTATEASAYADVSDGSASDDADGAPESSAVFSGAESEEG
jgi:cytoskeletal protein CcmA (bactofilin family)